MRPAILSAFAVSLGLSSPVLAADHGLIKRALQEASCIPANMAEVDRRGGRVSYVVTCREAPARALTLLCTSQRCFTDMHSDQEDGEVD